MKYHYRIRMADTDAAGRIYFAAACRIAHEAFEACMEVIGFGINEMIQQGKIVMPVVHLEATYRKPLLLGDAVDIHTTVTKIGERSVTLLHRFYTGEGTTPVEVRIAHAVLSGKNGKSVKIPPKLKKALQAI